MNLRDLRYLVAVGEYLHFGNAAEACFVSQPTLSTQIKKLEKELGVELIERGSRQVMLTDVGAEVVERAKVMLSEADSIRDITMRAQDPESGSLRLGLFPTLAPYLLPHVVGELHARFPKLELLLVEEKTEVLLQRLRDGQLDVALMAQPIRHEQLHEEYLFTEDFVLAVPAKHHLANANGPVSIATLAAEPVLLLEEGHCLRDQALSVCQIAGASERSGFRATSLETLRQMVAAGVGVTLLPELAAQPPVPQSEDVALLRFADPVPNRRIAMYWRNSSVYQDLLPGVAAVIREIAAGLVTQPTDTSAEPASAVPAGH
ncbi:MAG TPA: LysR substrate-binding domain-containing protein [Microthrixaceae bacterium]|nr:LysR substrate-binding domain-containing protein [Microthrixaceae bacterium]